MAAAVDQNLPRILITGVSSGIGLALASAVLKRGDCSVYGISRSVPPSLLRERNFHFKSVDLAEAESVVDRVSDWLIREHQLKSLQCLFLNAGAFGHQISAMPDVALQDINRLMQLNVWSNKQLLDLLLRNDVAIDECIVSSSIAGVRARAGNSAYAISKAALNMMIRLYALEHPNIHFSQLGLCNVDTFLSRTILSLPLEGQFPEQEKLRQRGKTQGYVVTPEARAADILRLLEGGLKERIASGEFIEIRDLL